jgi:hypothetical protein
VRAAGDWLAGDRDVPGVGFLEPQQQPDRRRLARARLADQCVRGAGRHDEGHVVDGRQHLAVDREGLRDGADRDLRCLAGVEPEAIEAGIAQPGVTVGVSAGTSARSFLAHADAGEEKIAAVLPASWTTPSSSTTSWSARSAAIARSWVMRSRLISRSSCNCESRSRIRYAYDSSLDGPARFVPHAAFEDPGAPADRLIQESIELRAFAFSP